MVEIEKLCTRLTAHRSLGNEVPCLCLCSVVWFYGSTDESCPESCSVIVVALAYAYACLSRASFTELVVVVRDDA